MSHTSILAAFATNYCKAGAKTPFPQPGRPISSRGLASGNADDLERGCTLNPEPSNFHLALHEWRQSIYFESFGTDSSIFDKWPE